MIGYGAESNHFVIELAYNYGIKSYELGNDCAGITIRSKDVIERAKQHSYPIAEESNDIFKLISPDGYTFFIENGTQLNDRDPVVKTTINCKNLNDSLAYWHDLLHMNIIAKNDKRATLSYDADTQAALELCEIDGPINRAKTSGRIAFAVPHSIQPIIDEKIKAAKQTILTPLITLDTPDKASVRVIILADPNEHEICFVDEEGFSQLSAVDPKGNELLTRYIEKDPFQ